MANDPSDGGAEKPKQPSEQPEEATIVDAKIGRPREGTKLGSDHHHLGRDPFGDEENKKALHRDPESPKLQKRTGLARESLNLKQFVQELSKRFDSKKKGSQVITEGKDSKSYMDESTLEEDLEDGIDDE